MSALAPTLSKPLTPLTLETPLPLRKSQQKQRGKKGKRLRFWSIVCSLILVVVIVMSQGNGTVGAWMADTLRALVGPTITAQVEAWYLNASNTFQQWQYQVANKQPTAPWQLTPVASPTNSSGNKLAQQPTAMMTLPMSLTMMQPTISPALPGEGQWAIMDYASGQYSTLPLDAKAFYRPDPSHPYAIVTLLKFDARFTTLHIIGGTREPGGPRGVYGPGIIPAADQKSNALIAAFNGGFKYADGQYGLMVHGVVYVPPQKGSATIAITKEGRLVLGAWGVDPLLNSQNTDLVSWRQNAALLIDRGVINPLTNDGAAWGGTILNSVYTWRSAIGISANGALIYAAGNALTAKTLAQAMQAGGAVMAMQTDINPFWVRAFMYHRDQKGVLSINKLNPQMQGTGNEYLLGTERDFFYLTAFMPPKPPMYAG